MASHKHKYAIADEEAVQLFVKLVAGGPHQQRRDKLLKALDQAAEVIRIPTKSSARRSSTAC